MLNLKISLDIKQGIPIWIADFVHHYCSMLTLLNETGMISDEEHQSRLKAISATVIEHKQQV